MNISAIISTLTLAAAIIVFIVCAYALIRFSVRIVYRKRYDLARHSNNPILSPQNHNYWETEGAFNPGAVMDNEGRVHLFYRAIGSDGLSRVGHAVSDDGLYFMERSMYPVFSPEPGLGIPEPEDATGPKKFDRSAYESGGGWGGTEDPRVVKIGDRIYMTYTAFGGWANMRIGVTSILENDLKVRKWKWRRPVLISPARSRAKNWVLFPEKINGKYAILHGIAPRILVAYVDSPEMAPKIESLGDHGGGGYKDKSRIGYWDERVRGAGAPPLKTRLGWLLLYHAIDTRNPSNVVGYKVGAMILDFNDPTRILYRSPEPILSPDMHYENDGKPGVVYASGAVIKDENLLVYYGGGDKHTCIAKTPLEPLLQWLVEYGNVNKN